LVIAVGNGKILESGEIQVLSLRVGDDAVHLRAEVVHRV
jgi:co-chaperonin GroES (HSP10)